MRVIQQHPVAIHEHRRQTLVLTCGVEPARDLLARHAHHQHAGHGSALGAHRFRRVQAASAGRGIRPQAAAVALARQGHPEPGTQGMARASALRTGAEHGRASSVEQDHGLHARGGLGQALQFVAQQQAKGLGGPVEPAHHGRVGRQQAGQAAALAQQARDVGRGLHGHLLQVARLGRPQGCRAAAQVGPGHGHHRQHGGNAHHHGHRGRQRPVARQQQPQPARTRRPAALERGGLVGALGARAGALAAAARGLEALQAGGVVGAQGPAKIGHGPGPLRRVGVQRPVDGLEEGVAVHVAAGFHGAAVGPGVGAAGFGVGRLPARHGPIQRGAQRVQVGPGALLARAVLLEGRVARRHHHQAVRGDARGLPRAAEVQQHEAAVAGAHLDVVGLDVAVQEARLVHGRQAVQQGEQQFHQRLLAQLPAMRPPELQRAAVLDLQHHVGRAEGLEEAGDADDGAVAKGSQRARLHEEAVQPLPVARQVLAGRRGDAAVGGAKDDVLREILLDRDGRVQVHVGREVGDAEAAFAQHAVDPVLVQPAAHG